MLLVFTRELGKISCGTSLGKNQRTKSSLALHPFTFGNYQIYQGKNYYNLDRAETIKSFYGIGEDLDRYQAASMVLELTEKAVPENFPQPAVFDLLISFLEELENKKNGYLTLVLAYELKLLRILGNFPGLNVCCRCGNRENLDFFSIPEGGVLCRDCAIKLSQSGNDALIYPMEFDIVSVINYLVRNSFPFFRRVALKEEQAGELEKLLRKYISYHLDIRELKSERTFRAGSEEVQEWK